MYFERALLTISPRCGEAKNTDLSSNLSESWTCRQWALRTQSTTSNYSRQAVCQHLTITNVFYFNLFLFDKNEILCKKLMYLAPPSGRAQCMTSHLYIPHSSCFSGQIVQLLSGKLNQHCELVSKRSSVAINTGVVCYEVSDPEPAVKNSWSRQTYSAFRYCCPKFKCPSVSTPTGQSEMCALCRRGTGCS